MSKNNKELIKEVIEELKKENLIKTEMLSPYQKMEKLISGYSLFESSIKYKKRTILDIKEHGLSMMHSTISERVTGGEVDYKSNLEKEQDKIDKLEKEIIYLEKVLKTIDDITESIKKDKYYDIVVLKYFEKKTLEEIADHFQVDVSTIKRNKNRLINIMSMFFVSIDHIRELIEN